MSEIKVALLGCGGIQRKHASTFIQRGDSRIVAMCDVHDAALDAFVERMGERGPALAGVARYTDPQAMYREARPDAVSICTPHTLHFQQGMQALEHDCHVLMEKPMVTAADEAHRLAAAVEHSGKVFVVGYNTPCSREFALLQKLIRGGELGRLQMVNGYLSQGWKNGTTGKWRQQPELSGGGMAYDSGAHILNSFCWSVESDIEAVHAFISNEGTPVDINASINVRFVNGVTASIAIGGDCPASGAFAAYLFEDGKIEIDPWNAQFMRVWRGKELQSDLQLEGEPTHPADNLLEAIAGRAQVRAGVRSGIIHSELMDAIYESARTGAVARPRRAG